MAPSLVTPIEKDRYERTAELICETRPGIPDPEEEILNGEMMEAGFARHYSCQGGKLPEQGSHREI